MEQFIREKIKDKPLNKKRLAKKAGTAALCGVAFAVAASIVFAIFLPVINRQKKLQMEKIIMMCRQPHSSQE